MKRAVKRLLSPIPKMAGSRKYHLFSYSLALTWGLVAAGKLEIQVAWLASVILAGLVIWCQSRCDDGESRLLAAKEIRR